MIILRFLMFVILFSNVVSAAEKPKTEEYLKEIEKLKKENKELKKTFSKQALEIQKLKKDSNKDKPIFAAQFENNIEAIFLDKVIWGDAGVKIDYDSGMTGNGIIVRRHAYDQKSSLVYKNINVISENGSILFCFKPNWDGTDNKQYELLNFISGNKEINLLKDKDNKLLLRFKEGNVIDGMDVLCKFKEETFSRILIRWNSIEKKYSLNIDSEITNGTFKNIGKTFFSGHGWDLWIGSKTSDRYTGDTAEGLFDDLKIYDREIDEKEVINVKEDKSAEGDIEIIKIEESLTNLKNVWAKEFKCPELLDYLGLYYAGETHIGLPYSCGELKNKKAVSKKIKDSKEGSISFWCKIKRKKDNAFTFMEILSKTFKYQFVYDPSISKINILISGNDAKKALNTTCNINMDEWNYFTVVWNKDILSLYANGVYQSYLRNPINQLEEIKEIKYSKYVNEIYNLSVWEKELKKNEVIKLFNFGTSVVFEPEPLSKYESGIWNLNDAQKSNSFTREDICLNGIWRFYPQDNNNLLPPQNNDKYYGRVPGRWLSPRFYKIYDKSNKEVSNVSGRNLNTCYEGWYARYIQIPESYYNKNIYLVVKYVGANSARIYANNKLVQTYSDRNNYNGLNMEYVYADLTGFNKQKNVKIDILISLNKYVPTWGWNCTDDVSLLDVSLQKYNDIYTKDTLVRTSVKDKKVKILSTIVNKYKLKGEYSVAANIYDSKGDLIKSSDEYKIDLGVFVEQNMNFEFKWENPVLWSHFNPVLYNLKLIIKDNKGVVVDESLNQKFGFREFEVRGGDFYLNNKKIHLFCERSLIGYWTRYGYRFGADKEFTYNTLKLLKEKGINSIDIGLKGSATLGLKGASGQLGFTPHYQENVLNAADELGMLVTFGVPSLENSVDIEVYKDEVENFVKVWGNHPSIILYMLTFNTCGYPWAQHPDMADNLEYIPQFKKTTRDLALLSEKIMYKIDPTREPYHNYSGNMSKIYTTMQYMSFGLPLQEREDWPSKWSKTKKTAFWAAEIGMPAIYQFNDFEGNIDGAEKLFVEHSARYFGDNIYKEIVGPGVIGGSYWSIFYGQNDEMLPEYLKTKSLFTKNYIRAWRCYDVSGVTMFGDLEDAHKIVEKNYVMDTKYDNLKTYGIKPDRMEIENRFTDLDKPNKYAYAIQESLKPILVTIGGSKENFNEKDHSYFFGEKIEKQAIVINDTMDDINIKIDIEFNDETGKQISKITRNAAVVPGEIHKEPFEFISPAFGIRKDYTILLKVYQDSKLLGEDKLIVEVFQKEKFNGILKNVGLYDTKGLTENLLKKSGMDFKKINSLYDMAGIKTLIIGRETLGIVNDEVLKRIEQSKMIENGLNVIIFEQKECNFANLIYEATSDRYVFIKDKKHPILAGLKDEDFINWRGSSDLIEAYSKPDPATEQSPHYPYYKWKWGNGGIVATYTIRKPQYGNFSVILDSNFDLRYTPLMEMSKGKGRIVVCQLDVTNRYGFDPVATKVVNNILNYSAVMENKAVVKIGYYGNENVFLKIMEDSKADFDKLTSLSDLSQYKLLILSPENFNEINTNKQGIEKFVKNGGSVLYLHDKDNKETFEWLPFEMRFNKIQKYNAFPDKEKDIIKGLGNSDFYWRAGKLVYTFELGEGKAVNPEIISVKKYDNGQYMFCGINPDNFKPVGSASFIHKEIHQKSIRIINTLFNNLGVTFSGLSLFGNDWYRNNEKKTGNVVIDLNEWKFNIDADDKGMSNNWNEKYFNDAEWKKISVPAYWEAKGYNQVNPNTDYSKETVYFQPGGDGYQPYDGYAWYRVKINIPEEYKGSKFTFVAGVVDDLDWTYFNGKEIGRTTLNENKAPWAAVRSYNIPEELIEFGKDNYLAIRVYDIHGNGGLGKSPVQITIQKSEKTETVENYSPYVKELSKYDVNAFHNW